jgi:hypothetical protein
MRTWIYLIGVMLLPIAYTGLMLATDQPIEWPVVTMMALITVPICLALVIKNSANKKAQAPVSNTGTLAPSPSNYSRSSKALITLGWTLVVTGAIAGATAIANYTDPNAAIAGPIVLAWVALGAASTELGVRMGGGKFPQIRRAFSPGTIGLGLAIVAISCGILYVFSHVLHVMPRIVLIVALLGVPGGILITAMCFEDVCAHCSEALKLGRLRFASLPNGIWTKLRQGQVREALEQLGSPQSKGEHDLDFWYCPKCRQIALYRPRNEMPFLLQGNTARLLTDLV